MTYDLDCRYDTRKSFYGKARVRVSEDGKHKELISYTTKVADILITDYDVIYTTEGHYSATTTRHQREFFLQNGLDEKSVKKLFKDGKLVEPIFSPE